MSLKSLIVGLLSIGIIFLSGIQFVCFAGLIEEVYGTKQDIFNFYAAIISLPTFLAGLAILILGGSKELR